jgi:hypothetical protein
LAELEKQPAAIIGADDIQAAPCGPQQQEILVFRGLQHQP